LSSTARLRANGRISPQTLSATLQLVDVSTIEANKVSPFPNLIVVLVFTPNLSTLLSEKLSDSLISDLAKYQWRILYEYGAGEGWEGYCHWFASAISCVA
jgi:hypothetical protein